MSLTGSNALEAANNSGTDMIISAPVSGTGSLTRIDVRGRAQPARHLGVAQFGLDVLRRQEVLSDELAQTLAELILLAFDDRGVWDRDAQWVPEQRGDREPVGERTHHAGLGGGAHVPDPRGGPPGLRPGAQQEDHRGAEQEGQCDGFHPPQAATAVGIGRRVRARDRLGEAGPFGLLCKCHGFHHPPSVKRQRAPTRLSTPIRRSIETD